MAQDNTDSKNLIPDATIDPLVADIRKIIGEIPLFSELNDSELNYLSQKTVLLRPTLGKNLAMKGDDVKNFFYVISGSIRKKENINGAIQSLGKISTGGFVGELGLISQRRWDYSVSVADSDSKILQMDSSDPKVREIASKTGSKIAYYQLLEIMRNLFFSEMIDEKYYETMASESFLLKVEPNDVVFKQGDANNSLYYVLKGRIDIYRENAQQKKLVGVVYPNEFFGEYGVLSGKTQGYQALVHDESIVVEIPYKNMAYVLLQNTKLQDLLNDNIKKFESELAKVDGGAGDSEDRNEYPEFKQTGEKKIRRFPWMHQHDESDCGAACLTMISKFYGLSLSMGQVREMANVSTEGATMGAVCRAAENLGYRARPYKLKYEGLKDVKKPCIIHWQGYHWVVLFKIDPEYVWLADPAIGIRKLPHQEFKQSWTRYLIELDPTEKLREIKPAKYPIMRFARYLFPYKFFFFEIFIGALVLNVLALASPLFIQAIIDNVVVYKDVTLLNMMLMGMVLVTFFSTLTSSIQQLVMIYVTTRLDLKLLADFYKHVLSLPMKFFYSRKTGDIITRFGENSKVRAILSGSAISTVLNVIMIVVYLTMMLAYSLPLSMVVLAFLPLFIAMTFIFTPIIKRISNDIFVSTSDQSSLMIESIQGIETIKANSIEWNVRTKWEDTYVKNVNLSAKMQRTQMIAGIISQTVNTSSSITLLWFGAHLVMDGSMSMGEFMGFNSIVGSVMGPIMGLVGLYEQYQNVSTSMERLNDVLELKSEEETPANSTKQKVFMTSVKGDIKLENVCFRYGSEDSPLVINNMNLDIKAGTVAAFVGKSGCGKSTLMKMFAGFNMSTSGVLSIDGLDIKNIDIYSLRKNIGWVLQDSFLFSGTVTDNIALGDTNPDMDAVIRAGKLAAADEFIVNFPMGYKTMIGEKGMAVSGGQRQRICIARALYRDPRIILMDEATSSLDAESEKRIKENLEGILTNRTAIIIAHRLSTIRNADIIYYLGDGRVLESGNHDELMKKRGLYYEMASEQIGGE